MIDNSLIVLSRKLLLGRISGLDTYMYLHVSDPLRWRGFYTCFRARTRVQYTLTPCEAQEKAHAQFMEIEKLGYYIIVMVKVKGKKARRKMNMRRHATCSY